MFVNNIDICSNYNNNHIKQKNMSNNCCKSFLYIYFLIYELTFVTLNIYIYIYIYIYIKFQDMVESI